MTNHEIQGDSNTSRVIMFTGKGGVGKTTCSATAALHYALAGQKTLAISTDATPSLSHIFGVNSQSKPARVHDSLFINELGIDEIKEMWDTRFGSEVYEVFSSFVSIEYDEFVDFMTSILPGLADEFMIDYIRQLSESRRFETIIWDTAPLGQTLALLKTPALLGRHLRMAPRIYSKLRLGRKSREPVLDILRRWESLSVQNMDFLRHRVTFILVTIPEALAVAQLEGIFREFTDYGLKMQRLLVNNVIKEDGSDFMSMKSRQQEKYLQAIHRRYSSVPVTEVPLFPYELSGVDRLREVEKVIFDARSTGASPAR